VPVLSRRHPSALLGRRPVVDGIAVAICAVVLAIVATSGRLEPPAHVHRLSVTNPTDWYATVAARPAGGGGWLNLGRVAPRTTATFTDVLDLGDTWELSFTYAGRVAAGAVVERAVLEDGDWVVTVPDDFAVEASATGLVPSLDPG
jgi:hypothetical protein